jgi:hypothetical protein
MELALNYARKFGDHNVTGLLLYNQSKNIIRQSTPTYLPDM